MNKNIVLATSASLFFIFSSFVFAEELKSESVEPGLSIECIKEDPPIKGINATLESDGLTIVNTIEYELDPEVWKKIGYTPNKCKIQEQEYILSEEAPLVKIMPASPKEYIPTMYMRSNTSIPTPSPKIDIRKIKNQKINGKAMLPVREAFNKLGLKVLWDKKNKKVIGSKKGYKIEVVEGSDNVVVNLENIKLMSAKAKQVKGTILIPLDFIQKEFKDYIQ